tara:strand:+ start:276 stop:1022 length:747 start_codon:yes stop_codon:yes gene_type:complete
MAKELPYFKFEPSEWQNGNIQMCSIESQIVFINVCCSYWQRLGELPYAFALQKHCGGIDNALQELCDNEIITIQDDKICIDFLDEQLEERFEKSQKASKSAQSRWNKTKNANASKTQSDRNAKREEEKREEKEVDSTTANAIDFDNLLKYINKTFGRKFQKINDSVKTKYKARIKEGYTSDDIREAINNCKKDHYHIETNYKYCTPEFFSRSVKIDLHSAIGQPEKSSDPMVEYVKQIEAKYGYSNEG